MNCNSGFGCSPQPNGCPTEDGCIPGICPDFTVRRHDTKPPFKVKIEDCDGPMDMTNLVLEATMWAKAKFKKTVAPTDTYFSLADNIGFNQLMVGDIIVVDRPRSPEQMLVVGFDEDDYLVLVERGYHGTTPQTWKKGTPLRIMKFMNSPGQTEMIYEDILQIDGTTTPHVLVDSFFIYEWGPNDTCLPGCYFLEFKLIKMMDYIPPPPTYSIILNSDDVDNHFSPVSTNNDLDGETILVFTGPGQITTPSEVILPSITPYPSIISGTTNIPSFTPPSDMPSTFGCGVGAGVEWVRRFPVDGEGFLVKITNSPTSEM